MPRLKPTPGPACPAIRGGRSPQEAPRSEIGGNLVSCFDAFSQRKPASTPHQVQGRLSLETALVKPALMAQAHHFLDKDRLLLVIEAHE